MTLERVLDEELLALTTRVEEFHGANEVSRAIRSRLKRGSDHLRDLRDGWHRAQI